MSRICQLVDPKVTHSIKGGSAVLAFPQTQTLPVGTGSFPQSFPQCLRLYPSSPKPHTTQQGDLALAGSIVVLILQIGGQTKGMEFNVIQLISGNVKVRTQAAGICIHYVT